MSYLVTIIDYRVGNVGSVRNAFIAAGADVQIVEDPERISGCERIVLPGVGAFAPAMEALKKGGMDAALKEHLRAGKPLLGICLGMQLLAERSEEEGVTEGLGWLPAEVVELPHEKSEKLPHMGWNSLRMERADPIFDGVEEGADVYFVHSFHVRPIEEDIILAKTPYSIDFASIVRRENVYGMQFHPEKSQTTGLRLLENFLKL